MVYKDYLQRTLFEEIGARCVFVRLDQVIDEVLARGHYEADESQLVSEALLLVALLSSGLKFSGRISLQLRGSGPLSLLLADCSDSGGLRGMLSWREGIEHRPEAVSLRGCAGPKAIMTLTLEPSAGGQRWQGIVPVEADSLADAVAAYFEQSEQLPTHFRIAVDGRRGAAVMLQRMPEQGSDEEAWNRLVHLFASTRREELLQLEGEALMRRLFHEESRRLFPARELAFDCPCSRERVRDVLVSLGEDELRQMASESDPTEVRCQFCNQRYRFDEQDLAALLRGDFGDDQQTVH